MTPAERDEYEEDLISFSDREIGRLGEIGGLDILYAGGASLLWLEGLSLRVGEKGTVTALDSDVEKIKGAENLLGDADLESPVRLVPGDVFDPPFSSRAFDLVYSAGLFHELDVSKGTAPEALAALASLVRPGGRVATSDFVSSTPTAQTEDEALQAELMRVLSGAKPYGIGPPERLIALHKQTLRDVRWHLSPPHHIRHLDGLVLSEPEPDGSERLSAETRRKLREGRKALHERIRREGYTRPATLYVEGTPREESIG